ncbi:hypothetical protein [Paenibacillus sp. IHBB 3054]
MSREGFNRMGEFWTEHPKRAGGRSPLCVFFLLIIRKRVGNDE